MPSSPRLAILLIASVLALLGGSILFAAFLHDPAVRIAGIGLIVLGAIGLWLGMKRLPG
ncbi:MAG: hypothetical protein JJT96_14785 [Opitutales bacterium]|nr:hypothetical protein [Opitutales bacterium]